jgi:putative membrane protein
MYQLRRCDGAMVLALVAALCATAPAAGPATEPQSFVLAATEAGLLEVEAARVAMNASTNSAVKSFADRVISDHGKFDAELAVIAKQKSITVPTQLDADRTKKLQWLRDRSIAEFDAAYAAQVVERYARTVDLFRANVVNGDAELAAYAARTLPLLEQHRRLADSLKKDLGKQQ